MFQLSLSKIDSPGRYIKLSCDTTLQDTATLQKQIKENEFRNVENNRRERPWLGSSSGKKKQVSDSLKR